LLKKNKQKKSAEVNIEVYTKRKAENSTFYQEEEKLNNLKTEVATLKGNALTILLEKARDYYKDTNNGSNLKVLTRETMLFIVKYLGEIKKLRGSLDDSDQEILTKVEALKTEVDSKGEKRNAYWQLGGDNFQEKLKRFVDEQFARDLYTEWKAVAELITLVNGDKKAFEELEKIVNRLNENTS